MTQIVIFVLILTCSLFAQCTFKANSSISLASGLACFRTNRFNQPYYEFTTAMTNLKTYLNSYTFKDTALYPNANGTGYDQPSVDIFGGLELIEHASYNNTFDFYERVMVLLNKLKDAHTYFVPPCVQKFSYTLPYYFSIYQNADLSQSVKIDRNVPTTYQKYISDGGVDFYNNTEILRINLKGKPIYNQFNELNDGTYLAAEAIANWADEQVSTARSSVTRWNIAAQGEFSFRPAAFYPHPEYEYITVEYKPPSGIVSSVRIPFYVYQSEQITSFNVECTIKVNGMNNIIDEKQNSSIFKRFINWITGKINNQQGQTSSITHSIEQLQMMQKHIQQQQQIVTQHIQERIRPKFFKSLTNIPILPINSSINISNNNNNNKPKIIRIPSNAVSNNEIAIYYLNNSQTGIIKIQSFNPSNSSQFPQDIYSAINSFKDESSSSYAKRVIIDVSSNPGGYIYLGAQTLRFLFPQAGHPIYPVVDQIRTPMNKEFAALDLYIQSNFKDQSELYVNPEDMSVDGQFYTRGGRQRKTTSNEINKSLEVELTEKYGFYMNHINNFITTSQNWKWKRQILYNPEDVLVVTDGLCASSCSQFIKAIQQKHLARIVLVGLRDPRDPNKRQDISIAGSGSATNVDSIQSLKNYEYYRPIWNISNIPGKFIRNGIQMGFADRALYGYTDDTKDQLMGYKIVDADFRYEVAPNPGDEIEDLEQISDFYTNILNTEQKLLGNKQDNKCLSWEVDIIGAASKGNCRGCLRGDQHSVYGHPCTTRGYQEQEGRNIDGTAKIGVFDKDGCVFSHCKVGYYRKNVNVNGTMKDQCVLIPLGYREQRSEVTPNQTEDVINQNDQCLTLFECKFMTETTPIETCPCPTDPNLFALDPRKDGLCKDHGVQTKFYNYFINKSSGVDSILNGQSESKPTRTIDYTIKILIGNINQSGEATLNIAAENYTENIAYTAKKPGVNVINIIGVSQSGTNKSYPALSNSAHPGQSALNIVGVGVHVQHFIFAYVAPLSLVSTIAPMILINAGSVSDWNVLASGQRNIVPNYLTHSFTDCIFQGSSIDYETGQKYGNAIGPLLSIIGAKVAIDNCHFNTKENIQILKGISSAMISAVFLYPDSGIIINNCNLDNLTQSSQQSETALRETGILNLTGIDQTQQQHLNNLPPSLAIFGVVDSISKKDNRNAKNAQIEVKSTHFINSKGESARSEAVLVDGFALVRSFNDLKNIKSNQMKHKLTNASPSYLPIGNLDGNSFENSNETTNAFVALGSGINYGLISNNHFIYNNTSQNKKNVLINFESAERVTESGGAENIIGFGNTYTIQLSEEDGSDQIQTSGLFTVEEKEDSSFDIQAESKVTVNIIDDIPDETEDKDVDIQDETKEKSSSLKAGAIVGIVFAVLVGIALVVVGIFFGIYLRKNNSKKTDNKQTNMVDQEDISQTNMNENAFDSNQW